MRAGGSARAAQVAAGSPLLASLLPVECAMILFSKKKIAP